jgi:transposase-like protein
MGLSGTSKSTMSELCKEIDERVHEFLDRPLTGEWRYLWLDATYPTVRQGGRIGPVTVWFRPRSHSSRLSLIGQEAFPAEG